MAWIKATIIGILCAVVALPLAIVAEAYLRYWWFLATRTSESSGIGAVSVPLGPWAFVTASAAGIAATWWALRRSRRTPAR